jgi:hypothetical protein
MKLIIFLLGFFLGLIAGMFLETYYFVGQHDTSLLGSGKYRGGYYEPYNYDWKY